MIELTKVPYNLNDTQIKYVKQLVENMTIQEKIGQLFFVIGPDEDQTDIAEFIQKYQPGGVMYRPNTAEKIKREFLTSQKASSFPLFTAANLESGGNGIVTEGTWVGMPLQIAATDDVDSAYQLGKISGYEANQVGCNMSFSPIIDIDLNFRNPITNTRTFGSDIQRIYDMATAQIKGLAENHVIPVIKHFPGDGVDERDQHLVTSINSLSKEEWSDSFGSLYQKFIDEGIPSIMIGHIMQPAWEKTLNPSLAKHEHLPASVSSLLINGLLRQELGFNGLTISDATPMIGYNVVLPRHELLPATINAGVDMLLFNKNIDEDYQIIRQAIENGQISNERLDEAVTRIMATKVAQGLMDLDGNSRIIVPEKIELPLVNHQKEVKEIAKKSVTLVKDTQKLLPVTPKKYPRVRLVVLGDQSDGGFKEGGSVTDKFKQGLEQIGFQVTLFDQRKLDFHEIFKEGVSDLEKKFDLALYVANVETASNQTTTRIDWVHLMAADAPWFVQSIPTLFVSMANPYHLFDVPYISTYINAYSGNQASVDAVLSKISGGESFEGINPVDPFCGVFLSRV